MDESKEKLSSNREVKSSAFTFWRAGECGQTIFSIGWAGGIARGYHLHHIGGCAVCGQKE